MGQCLLSDADKAVCLLIKMVPYPYQIASH